jgi:hypothetical protein
VLFITGKYSLNPGAREKLAKVAGILLAYPGLAIAVGGYTDNVASRTGEWSSWYRATPSAVSNGYDQQPQIEQAQRAGV